MPGEAEAPYCTAQGVQRSPLLSCWQQRRRFDPSPIATATWTSAAGVAVLLALLVDFVAADASSPLVAVVVLAETEEVAVEQMDQEEAASLHAPSWDREAAVASAHKHSH